MKAARVLQPRPVAPCSRHLVRTSLTLTPKNLTASPVCAQLGDEWMERSLESSENEPGFGALGCFVLAEVLAAKPPTGKPGWEGVQASWREAMQGAEAKWSEAMQASGGLPWPPDDVMIKHAGAHALKCHLGSVEDDEQDPPILTLSSGAASHEARPSGEPSGGAAAGESVEAGERIEDASSGEEDCVPLG